MSPWQPVRFYGIEVRGVTVCADDPLCSAVGWPRPPRREPKAHSNSHISKVTLGSRPPISGLCDNGPGSLIFGADLGLLLWSG